jgi:hypothetical protein
MVGLKKPLKYNNMKRFVVQKQLVPSDVNTGDANWAKRQIWVLKLNGNDTIDEFDTLEEAISKKDELFNDDPTQRIYKVVENVDGSFVDL